ncbi:glycosyltransferase family 2 protein [Hyphomonas oceanitis]|uniref:Glycosyl transferase family 2 n=1 Tax=Hyphomonas oceanitis SCH89 TaxID=1280953 RepID=A0A059G1K7_9PROT|nr:glycosyltransferase [Hyphomonas oceanitis]KDA00701.1 glycosyl transferase family 2 [Hyphomonas oceanitis SCH89]
MTCVANMNDSNPVILIPVLDDWDSLDVLLAKIGDTVLPAERKVDVIVVDDGSSRVPEMNPARVTGTIDSVRVLSLKANQGHQRALALGLAHVYNEMSPEFVMVMDSDGEDQPQDLPKLVAAFEEQPDAIIVAQCQRRSEGLVFRLFYQLYKLMFIGLTGKLISFGNFSLIPAARQGNVIFNSGVWNNFAATILKSRVPIAFVPTHRGTRYHGKSKMNFTSLMIHGFSAMAIFSDVVIGRLIFLLSVLSAFVILIIAAVVVIKFGTTTFVPGYATNIILFLVSCLSLSMLTGFLMILSLLARREQASALPTQMVAYLVRDVIHVAPVVSAELAPV